MTTETETKKVIAAESGHWYDGKTGEPRYTIIGKNGKKRATTLRDARTENLVPSVTSVLGLLTRPGLEAWKQNNILLSAATMPHDPNIPLEAWCDAVVADAKAQSEKAMQLGTDIHAAIEIYLNGETIDPLYIPYVMPVIQEMEHRGWLEKRNIEHSFAHKAGFGGKSDFFNDTVMIDFKTKAFTRKDVEENKKLAWDEQCYQLAAYRYGMYLEHLACINIFISTTEPGLFYVHEWDNSEIQHGEGVFLQALKLWKLIKNF